MPPTPLILGHRGASAVAPENTLGAFARAMQEGADGVEFDVRLSRDGVPVVIHDDNLKRTGLTSGRVNQLTAAELQKIDVGKWFTNKEGGSSQYLTEKIPTLAQVYGSFSSNNGLLYVELKCDPSESATLAREVVQTTQQAQFSDRVVILSFDLPAILTIKEIDPGIRTAALFEPRFRQPSIALRKVKMIEIARRHLADELALHYTLAVPRLVEEALAIGLATVVWTVDDPLWIERARSMGIKALITNDPASMLSHREKV